MYQRDSTHLQTRPLVCTSALWLSCDLGAEFGSWINSQNQPLPSGTCSWYKGGKTLSYKLTMAYNILHWAITQTAFTRGWMAVQRPKSPSWNGARESQVFPCLLPLCLLPQARESTDRAMRWELPVPGAFSQPWRPLNQSRVWIFPLDPVACRLVTGCYSNCTRIKEWGQKEWKKACINIFWHLV